MNNNIVPLLLVIIWYHIVWAFGAGSTTLNNASHNPSDGFLRKQHPKSNTIEHIRRKRMPVPDTLRWGRNTRMRQNRDKEDLKEEMDRRRLKKRARQHVNFHYTRKELIDRDNGEKQDEERRITNSDEEQLTMHQVAAQNPLIYYMVNAAFPVLKKGDDINEQLNGAQMHTFSQFDDDYQDDDYDNDNHESEGDGQGDGDGYDDNDESEDDGQGDGNGYDYDVNEEYEGDAHNYTGQDVHSHGHDYGDEENEENNDDIHWHGHGHDYRD